MADETTGQKTEKPTPKKLREARKKGQIARSPDLVGWVALLAATWVIPMTMRSVEQGLSEVLLTGLQAAMLGDEAAVWSSTRPLFGLMGLALLPLFAVVMIVTILGLVMQGGVVLSLDPLKPKVERISIKSGVKRLFSSQSIVDTLKSVIRLAVLIVLTWNVITVAIAQHLGGAATELSATMPILGGDVLRLVRLSALAGIVVGFGDYAFQRYKTGKQLKMSKYEVKQESKQTDGDPMVRSRRRAAHQQLNRNQMLAAVPDASAVVVNPTHVAVAIKYSEGGVPTVVAKGGDELAMRIRERAFQSSVPVLEVRPLARILFETVEVGDEVPASLYEAVAIVIAFVMRAPASTLKGAIRRVSVPRRAMRDAPPPAHDPPTAHDPAA